MNVRAVAAPLVALGLMAAAGPRPGLPGGAPAVGALAWPLSSWALTQPYGCSTVELEPEAGWCSTGHFHSGIDLAAPAGTVVRAAAAGTARVARSAGGYGLAVVLDHGSGTETLYGHLESTSLRTGDVVTGAEEIGRVGSSGLSTGPHLHFEVRRDGRPVDPLPLLPAEPWEVTPMLNKVILVGRLTADPEVRSTAAGRAVANVRLATNTYAGQEDDGSRREHTEFHTLVLFGQSADFAAQHLRKGRLVYAEGRTQTRSWETTEGQRRYATEVVVDQLQAIGPKPAEAV